MKNRIIIQFTSIFILSASMLQAGSFINEALMKKINSDGDETSCAMTDNGKFFIFSRKLKGKDNSDLYSTRYKNGKWSEPAATVDLNSDADEISPYISSDGKFILFSSNRNGSLKSRSTDKPSYDIYYSERKNEGWEKPELLFGAVNTTFDELNPFIIKEGNVLYFTRSLPESGSKSTVIKVYNREDSWEDIQTAEISKNSAVDIYMYKKSSYRPGAYVTGLKKDNSTSRKVYYTDDSEGKIAEFSSITDSANSAADEISVSELSRDSIIVSSNSSGIAGSYDFFIKKIPKQPAAAEIKNISPRTFTLKIDSGNYSNPDGVKVKVLFFTSIRKNSWPVKSEFKTPDSSGILTITTDPGTRRVLILPGSPGMKSFAAEFLTENKSISTSAIKIEQSIEKEFIAKPVYFGFNSSEIEITDIPYLHELIDYMRLNKKTRILLQGYSDGIGSYRANLDISLRRAERLKEYLVKAGIKSSRIKTKGLGYIKEKTPDTSQYNRRVESDIIK